MILIPFFLFKFFIKVNLGLFYGGDRSNRLVGSIGYQVPIVLVEDYQTSKMLKNWLNFSSYSFRSCNRKNEDVEIWDSCYVDFIYYFEF